MLVTDIQTPAPLQTLGCIALCPLPGLLHGFQVGFTNGSLTWGVPSMMCRTTLETNPTLYPQPGISGLFGGAKEQSRPLLHVTVCDLCSLRHTRATEP